MAVKEGDATPVPDMPQPDAPEVPVPETPAAAEQAEIGNLSTGLSGVRSGKVGSQVGVEKKPTQSYIMISDTDSSSDESEKDKTVRFDLQSVLLATL